MHVLHGVAAHQATLGRLDPLIAAEMETLGGARPARRANEEPSVSPLMVHKAQTALDLVAWRAKAGCPSCAKAAPGGDYGAHSQAVARPHRGLTLETSVRVDWDGRRSGLRGSPPTSSSCPILCAMELPTSTRSSTSPCSRTRTTSPPSIYTRDDDKLHRARRTLGGMLKENDGTDSALEWEEFGASTIGECGNMGVGEIQATLAIFCRRQKGRHLTF